MIAFKENVEGVLLACSQLLDRPDHDLVFAKDLNELRDKISFSGIEGEMKVVGFKPVANCSELAAGIFCKRKSSRMSQRDPGVERYIDLVLRHSSCNPAELVHLICSCAGDANHLYSGKALAGKRYYNYMRDVIRAYQKLCMFARPDLVNGILSVKVDSPHFIGDMFCRWLAGKNPDLPVYVVEKDIAWIGNGHYLGLENFMTVRSSFVEHLSFSREDDEVDHLWDVYYDSQMIPSRRNKRHSKHLQPKSSASVSEMSRRDRYKVERGIASCTLDRFNT
ncbi:DUF4130 domain-containing protein [Methanolobus halotolerans]|uniref:DUF4130 domain-containing protein n=1 Tax=Methanolobus halotolerans TaxID=2052935 RepID=A0A4E0QQR8_9EURY|nr:DUF4130 domain-containing protein [Methanolobus halotolerans]